MFIDRRINRNSNIGIDIGSKTIRVVQLEYDRNVVRVKASSELGNDDGISFEDSDYFRKCAKKIVSGLSKKNFSGKKLNIVLPENYVRVKNARFPKLDDDELKEIVKWEAAERIGYSDSVKKEVRYVNTGVVRQGGEEKYELLLMAASTHGIEVLLEELLDAGYEVEKLLPSPCLLGHVGNEALSDGQVIVGLDVGYSGSRIVISDTDGLRFYKSIAIGLKEIDLKFDRVEKSETSGISIRSNWNTVSQVVREKYLEIIRPMIDEIVNEISLCLRYDSVVRRGQRADVAVLMGGGDGLPGLRECMVERLGVDIIQADLGICLESGEISRDMINRWCVALMAANISQLGESKLKGAA